MSTPPLKAAPRSGFVAVIGLPNVGKSTLVNRLVGQKVAIVSPRPQTTRNRILAVVNHAAGQMVLFDTPGIHKPRDRMNKRMLDEALGCLTRVDAVLWLVDVTKRGPTDRHVKKVLATLEVPVLLGVNKIDKVQKPSLLPAIDEYRRMLDFEEIVPISATKGDNVDVLADRLLAQLPEGEPLYPMDFLTDQPERFLVAEIVREKLFRKLRDELPYSLSVVVESFHEGEKLVRIECVVLVDRDSHKSIVIGRRGEMLKAVGTEARHEIEALLGTKVYLGLFVKMRRDWRDDPRTLEQIGLGKH